MTIAEVKNFYKLDAKKYDIDNNKDFLAWINNKIAEGYKSSIHYENIQNLIDKIVNWYEFKYPEREMNYFNSSINPDNADIKKLSDDMNIRQLLLRLSNDQLHLIEGEYRATGVAEIPNYENNIKVSSKRNIYMRIKEKESEDTHGRKPYFLIFADNMTGIVSKDIEQNEYIDSSKDITLEELLSTFNEKYANELEYSELKKCIFNHKCDIELRDKILQLVALKILYSKNTVPQRGYERAKKFIKEFNNELGTHLTTNEIDNIMNKDYSDDALLFDTTNIMPEYPNNSIKRLIKRFPKKNNKSKLKIFFQFTFLLIIIPFIIY